MEGQMHSKQRVNLSQLHSICHSNITTIRHTISTDLGLPKTPVPVPEWVVLPGVFPVHMSHSWEAIFFPPSPSVKLLTQRERPGGVIFFLGRRWLQQEAGSSTLGEGYTQTATGNLGFLTLIIVRKYTFKIDCVQTNLCLNSFNLINWWICGDVGYHSQHFQMELVENK